MLGLVKKIISRYVSVNPRTYNYVIEYDMFGNIYLRKKYGEDSEYTLWLTKRDTLHRVQRRRSYKITETKNI